MPPKLSRTGETATKRTPAIQLGVLSVGLVASLLPSYGQAVGRTLPTVQAARHASTARACVQPPAGLVSWWPGDGNAHDIRGGNNGSFPGNPYARGMVGRAFLFSGQGNGVFIPDHPNLMLTHSLTIEAWVNGSYVTGPHAQIFFRGDSRPYLDPYSLRLLPNGQIEFHIESTTNKAELDAPFPGGQWVYVAATFNDRTGLMSLYLNGSLVAAMQTAVRPFGALDPSQQPGLAIGGLQKGSPGAAEPFRGRIDELSVYNRALSGAVIQSIYHAGSAGKCKVR